MAKTKLQQEQFINLRALGYSFDSIAKQINVSKPVLISWNRQFEKEINNSIYFETQELLEKYKQTKQTRIENISKILQKVNEAIDKINFENVSTKDLFSIKNQLEQDLINEINGIEFKTDEIAYSFMKDNFKTIKLY